VLRAVIFDYGNTLVGIDPSTPSGRTDYADVVARPGAERLAAHLEATGVRFGKGGAGAFVERFLDVRERNRRTADQTGREITATESLEEALGDSGAGALTATALHEALTAYFAFEESCIVPLEGAIATLQAVRDTGARLALLSNATDGRYIERVAARLGMGAFFDPFVVSADIGVRKPRAEAFRSVLDGWKLAPMSVAMVGDSLHHDIDGAKRLGIRTVHLTQIENPGDAALQGIVVPDFTAPSHEALRSLLAPLLDAAP
jgi:HAD superfamily hydrolase (TIGR01509 family)